MDLRLSLWNKLNAEHVGESAACTQKSLAAYFRVNPEQIRDAIKSLRRDGYLIASMCKAPFGYFIPLTDAEVERYITQLESGIDEKARTLEVQREAAKAKFPNVRLERTFVINHPDHERQQERMIPVPAEAAHHRPQEGNGNGVTAGDQQAVSRLASSGDSPCEPTAFIPPAIRERFNKKLGWTFGEGEAVAGVAEKRSPEDYEKVLQRNRELMEATYAATHAEQSPRAGEVSGEEGEEGANSRSA